MPIFPTPVRRLFFAGLLVISPAPIRAQGTPDQPFELEELSKLGQLPTLVDTVPPIYPYEMSRAGLTGVVRISFVIDAKGRVQDAYIVESNNPWFERTAINAIQQWKFKPGVVNGHPVTTHAEQTIEFTLDPDGVAPAFWRVAKSKDHDQQPPEFQWDSPPQPVKTMFPVYPFAELKAGAGGKARVSYVVGPDGRVGLAKVQQATAPEFGAAVLAMIEAWRFEPAKKKDGTPCYAMLNSEYEFVPAGRGDVPVSETARDILREIKRSPAALATPKDLDQPLKPRIRRAPIYPTALREAGGPGQAVIEFFIDDKGDAQLPRIVSSTAPEFGYAAVQAVATWRYDVPRKQGQPVAVRVQIPVDFKWKASVAAAQTP